MFSCSSWLCRYKGMLSDPVFRSLRFVSSSWIICFSRRWSSEPLRLLRPDLDESTEELFIYRSNSGRLDWLRVVISFGGGDADRALSVGLVCFLYPFESLDLSDFKLLTDLRLLKDLTDDC